MEDGLIHLRNSVVQRLMLLVKRNTVKTQFYQLGLLEVQSKDKNLALQKMGNMRNSTKLRIDTLSCIHLSVTYFHCKLLCHLDDTGSINVTLRCSII